MNTSSAKRLVLLSLIVTGTLVTVNEFSNGRTPSLRTGVGLAVLGAMLGLGAEVAPKITGPLAALVMTSTVVSIGGDAIGAITGGVNLHKSSTAPLIPGGPSTRPVTGPPPDLQKVG